MAAPVLSARCVVFVNKVGTDDAGYNAVGQPWSRLTIAAAIADLLANYPAPSATNPCVIAIGPGVYVEEDIDLPPWVWLTGSADADSPEPTIIQIAGGDIAPSVDWATNTTARGGLSNLVIRASSGTPLIDFTMPVPTAGNPSRTIEIDGIITDLDNVIFEATSTADVFKANGLIHDGNLTNDVRWTGGTIAINNVVSNATNTIASKAAFAATAVVTNSRFATIALNQVATALTVLADVVSLATTATISTVGAPTITRISDANGLGYTPTVPASWPAGTDTVQKALDDLAAGGALTSATGTATVANAAGNTTVTPTAHVWTERITFTGAAGTRIVIADVTGRAAGDTIDFWLSRADGGGIVAEVRNATAGGTLLATFPDATGTTTGRIQLVYGTIATGYAANAFVAQSFQIPATI